MSTQANGPVDPSAARRRAVDELLAASGGKVLVVTGAGISSASGIPTFRGNEKGAIWRQHDVEMATFEYFRRDPVGQWAWYLERFASIDGALPNRGHFALRRLQQLVHDLGGDLVLVTQNIDCLHEAAGSRHLIKVHGSSDRVRCSSAGRCELAAPGGSLPRTEVDLEAFRNDPGEATLPRCPRCDAVLRAHVLFFDEYYAEHIDYRFDEVELAARTCDVALFVGTSFSVGVTDLILRQALARGRQAISIDPAGLASGLPDRGILLLAEPAEAALPAICTTLAERGGMTS